MVYLVTLTFSWFFKVHFGFLSLKCKSGIISVVFCRGLPCHSYIPLIFQSSFWVSFIEMQELEYCSSVLVGFTLSQLHSLDFHSSFWFLSLKCKSWNISLVFCCWFTLSQLHSLDFSKLIWISLVKCKSWNISVVFRHGLPCHSYILLIFQSSFWISFVEMQESDYFSSV